MLRLITVIVAHVCMQRDVIVLRDRRIVWLLCLAIVRIPGCVLMIVGTGRAGDLATRL